MNPRRVTRRTVVGGLLCAMTAIPPVFAADPVPEAEPSRPAATTSGSPTGGNESAFPVPENTEPLAVSHPQLSPSDSAAAIRLPAGFDVSVFAAEPDAQNPIDLAWDHRGRMWVAENYTYAKSGVRFRDDLRDRVVVFTDEDCDGTPESRTVFLDTLSRLTSVEVGPGKFTVAGVSTAPGRGDELTNGVAGTRDSQASPQTVDGVWLMCPPQLLFVPDADHDMVPDAPPRVVLDGFDVAKQNYHNFANGLRFGPDGWLYGRCGGSCPGRVGAPGTPDAQRVALEGGMWRFDVRTERFEAICHGTTNPWGHDFNSFGELFFINTVNGHLWHGIHGAHFNRPFTLDPNPNVYATIDQHADHYHFDTGQHWTKSRDGAANDFGGGHAHCGLMIYQESTWPSEYRDSLMTLNFHGRRANRENLLRRGSGYVGTHGDDFFLSDDEWFRGMEMSAGPDGNVFVLDWSDLGECHEHTGVHRTSGRIYKITARQSDTERQTSASLRESRLKRLADGDVPGLIEMVSGEDRWFSHQAALRLRELRSSGVDVSVAIASMSSSAKRRREADHSSGDGIPDAASTCRMLWTLDCLDGFSESGGPVSLRDYDVYLSDPSEHVRAAAIRSFTQRWPIDDVYGPNEQGRTAWPQIADQANELIATMDRVGAQDSALIRLTLASTLQRLPIEMRASAATKLLQLSGDQDVGDHNFAKMVWYGVMSRSSTHPREMIDVASASRLPELTTYLARSVAEQIETTPIAFGELAAAGMSKLNSDDVENARRWCDAMFAGIEQGLVGIRRAEMPSNWPQFKTAIRAASLDQETLLKRLDTLFGDGLSTERLAEILDDKDADLTERLNALKGLVAAWHEAGSNDPAAAAKLVKSAKPLVASPHVNLAAAETLATIEHPAVAQLLLDHYGRFRAPLRASVVSLLCSRMTFATALVERLERTGRGKLSKDALDASHVRGLVALGDPDLTRRVESVWGRVRETPGERLAEMSRLKAMLTPDRLRRANLSDGRVLFDRMCSTCHRMFGAGELVGPDLTGAQRGSLDYLLSNIVDPDAVVGVDFRATKILTLDGRLLVGLVTQRTRRTLTIASDSRTETISLDEVEDEFPTESSPMPSGLLQPLSDNQIANLIAYLQSPVQVAGAQSENAD
ncbi:PVC-type heme-binding CxxCH protein [Aporhodopirellula aestuarii]|uniref:C-type cytochrome n=1 Tax=Aporhodopirellula aestuarii TaxID=2950107 RepID=A0ABT0UE71_9BACT|nr:PVC-type heme-binding CxxCH protein [Aporhodopirellula aestuarii]MCM2375210.1 c-type cytochrome [Aporhodopirellula aestuarii]